MEDKKYLMALDASTSKIGISLFEDMGDYGELVGNYHIELDGTSKDMHEIWAKVKQFVDHIAQHCSKLPIKEIVIEEPLLTTKQIHTATLLNRYNGMLYAAILNAFGFPPEYISVDNARRYALPELLGVSKKGKGKLMGDYPSKIAGLGRGDWTKFLIMYLVNSRYKDKMTIKLNRNMSIDVSNFDRADSVVVGLGYMIKSGKWKRMADNNFWGELQTDYESCIKVIEKNIAYATFLSSDEFSIYSADEKKIIKKKYLKEVYEIQKYFNVDIDNQ